ncbi:MAG: VWA domain-containing protein [Xanthomonadales bacterium]|nr:VWA domain-containing protein [Xanthomonadales bacterium]
MKTKLTALIILTITAVSVMAYPHFESTMATPYTGNQLSDPLPADLVMHQQSKIEVVFVLDTTSSMSGMIEAAKEKIWSIASTMASAQNAPEIKMGLVAFRDRGDSYVTKILDLSSDLDSMYAALMDYRAEGGGDGPESVNQAIYDAVHKISWSQDKQTYRVVFLLGDAPPHMDYLDDVPYSQSLKIAQQKGIKFNAIQAGQSANTTHQWKQIASLGGGLYFQVEQGGSAIAISTPFDQQMAKLSSKLDETKLYFGNKEEQKRQQSKLAASSKLRENSSAQAQARRVAFNTSTSGKQNFLGEGELVDAVIRGEVSLEAIDTDELPESLQRLKPAAQMLVIQEYDERRKKLKQDILKLSEKRTDYLKKEVAKLGGSKGSLDDNIYEAVRSQAAEKGLVYAEESASY